MTGQVSPRHHYNNKNLIKMDDLIVIIIVEIQKISRALIGSDLYKNGNFWPLGLMRG